MPSGYQSGGTDLDSLFKSDSGYSGSISAEYKVGGSTSYTRYKARGSSTKRADVGYRINGTDISNNFMDINFVEVSLTNQNIGDYSTSMGLYPQASYQILYTGDVYGVREVESSPVFLENWLGGGNASDYEVRVTKTSGPSFEAGSSATDTWLSLAASNVYTWSTAPRTANGITTITFTIEIRMAASPNTVLATASVTLSAEYAIS